MSDIANGLKFYSDVFSGNSSNYKLQPDMENVYNYAIEVLTLNSNIDQSLHNIEKLKEDIDFSQNEIDNTHFKETFPYIEKFKNSDKLRLKLEEQNEINTKLRSNRLSFYVFGIIFLLGLIGVLYVVGAMIFSNDKNLITVDESFLKYTRLIILLVSGFFTILGGILMIPKKEADIIREVKIKYAKDRTHRYELQDRSNQEFKEVTKRYELFKQVMNCLINKLNNLKLKLQNESNLLNSYRKELNSLVCPIDPQFNDLDCMREIVDLVNHKAVFAVKGTFQCEDRLSEHLKIRKVNEHIDQCFNTLSERIDYAFGRIDSLSDTVYSLSNEIDSLNVAIDSVSSYASSIESSLENEMNQRYNDLLDMFNTNSQN